ncbi:Rtr1/RPAP2 family-domain-containing protein [Aspergillus ambiguus]|uniref:Rtr1/RPAP2 family protein phosphatase n=1 Tax=Aspergillus ambiguus TaxID=176160 RepID=UPI003CCD9F69
MSARPLKTSLPSAHAASSTSPPQSSPMPPQMSHQQNKPDADPRHLAIALHHAHRIQAQKDTEALILDRILDLVSFPSAPDADPAAPSPDDANTFKAALAPFQPADYDNLILERNIEGLCGYALCPREHRKENAKGTYRITWGAKGTGPGGRGREMNIVPREKLEMWCSDACAERAMYIRVQLAQEPVWERRADDRRGKDILLLEEGRARSGPTTKDPATVNQVAGQLDRLQLGPGQPSSSRMAEDLARLSVRDEHHAYDLALERGDSPALYGGRVDVQVRENQNLHPTVRAPEMGPDDLKGGSIEGYMPRDD